MDVTYRVSHDCTFRMDDGVGVEVRVGSGPARRLPADLASFLLQLGPPRTAAQIHRTSGTPTPLPELERVLDQLSGEGLLVREGGAPPAPPPSLVGLLRPDIFGDPSMAAAMAEHLRRGRLLVIRDALPLELAERVHAELEATTAWSLAEKYLPHFHYRRRYLEPTDFPPSVRECAALFGSPATKALIGDLCGRPCDGDTIVSPSWFQAGDHISPHEDNRGCRAVAYVWHLTRGWDERWGGNFVWSPTGTVLEPAFNRLLLFAVSREGSHNCQHSVSVVSPHARQQRLSIGGWWYDAGEPSSRGRTDPARPGDELMSTHCMGRPRCYVGEGDAVTIL